MMMKADGAGFLLLLRSATDVLGYLGPKDDKASEGYARIAAVIQSVSAKRLCNSLKTCLSHAEAAIQDCIVNDEV